VVGLNKTRAEAKRVIQQKGLLVNGVQATEDVNISKLELIHGKYVVLQSGKKNFALI